MQEIIRDPGQGLRNVFNLQRYSESKARMDRLKQNLAATLEEEFGTNYPATEVTAAIQYGQRRLETNGGDLNKATADAWDFINNPDLSA